MTTSAYDFVNGPLPEFVHRPVNEFVTTHDPRTSDLIHNVLQEVGAAQRDAVSVFGPKPLVRSRYMTGTITVEIHLLRVDLPQGDFRVRRDFQWTQREIRHALEVQLTEQSRVVIGRRSAFGVELLDGLVLDLEVNLRDWAIALAATVDGIDKEFTIGGVSMRIRAGAVKVRIEGVLTEEGKIYVLQLAARLLSRVIPWAAAPAAGAALGVVAAHAAVGFVESWHEPGRLAGLMYQVRWGYAVHLACLVGGGNEHQCHSQIERTTTSGDWPALHEHRELGWEAAAIGWADTAPKDQIRLTHVLGPWQTGTWKEIFRAIGGEGGPKTQVQPLPHPRDIADLIKNRPGMPNSSTAVP